MAEQEDKEVNQFPNVFRPITLDAAKIAIDYAINNFQNDGKRIENITRLKNNYNKKASIEKRKAIETIKGYNQSKVKYVDYAIDRTIIDQLMGEWIELKLNATAYAFNESAINKKNEILADHLGLNELQPEVNKLKQNKIVNVMGGMQPIPFDENGNPKINIQLENEIIVQHILNDAIKNKGIKDMFYINRLDDAIASECFGKVYIDVDGFTKFRPIDVRNRMSEESEFDIFGKQSPYIGERREMFYHQIINEYPDLDSDDIKKLKSIKKSAQSITTSTNNYRYVSDKDKTLLYDVYTIEFMAYEPWFITKTAYHKNADKYVKSELSPEYYYRKEKKIKNDVKNEKYKIEIKYKQVKYTITRIADTIYTAFKQCENVPGSVESPFETEYDYIMLLHNTVNGDRVSYSRVLEDTKEQYNLCRFMINRELAKYKGLTITYDEAMIPRKNGQARKIDDIIADMVNDGIMKYNSLGDGAYGSNKIDKTGFDVKDLGLSKNFPQLVEMALTLEDMASRLIGFNKPRQGQTPASQTATSANNDLSQSRSTTAVFNYFFDRYIEEVLNRYVSRAKITYGRLHKDKAIGILGYQGSQLLQNHSIDDDDYKVIIGDARREDYIRQVMRLYLPQAINAGINSVDAAMEAEMADTLAEAKKTLSNNTRFLKQLESQQANVQQQAVMQMKQADIAQKDKEREDNQAHDKEMLIMSKELDGALNTQVANNEMISKQQDLDDELTLSEQQNS